MDQLQTQGRLDHTAASAQLQSLQESLSISCRHLVSCPTIPTMSDLPTSKFQTTRHQQTPLGKHQLWGHVSLQEQDGHMYLCGLLMALSQGTVSRHRMGVLPRQDTRPASHRCCSQMLSQLECNFTPCL
ncbi:unnamed protein product [Rangifer tarandus platyrhynchus]|uniref:Uncharacterized protein n=1 Tax=Rangifer tarandus platyrhynchus TaxID=3082113 RepID=A0AC59YFM9_RANTA